ncbi:streptophobe family protein [Streptomyces sp. NPDC047315]|uniref:streptophobe family protein n=1 Tax=Streptomyces sp. NPDC047315 TaxID=3155142 RepID=UPI00341186BC
MRDADRIDGTTGAGRAARVPWGEVVLSAVAAVSWAFVGMAGVAALGLHLLEADASGSLGPMTAAVVVLAVGGSVEPSGDVSAFGLEGAGARTAIDITPLGVSLVGALLLAYVFLRSLRRARVYVPGSELAARAGAVVALFVAVTAGLAWAGHEAITFDGGKLGSGGASDGGVELPGIGDVDLPDVDVPGVGDLGGLLPDRLGDLVDAQASVGYRVETGPSLLAALVWVVGVLVIALLAGRRAPLPRSLDGLVRPLRPAASALVSVAVVAVLAGYAAAGYAAIGDENPKLIAGSALLGAPNGVWLGIPLGLFVPWEGRADGDLARLLPDPLDEYLRVSGDEPVTVARLAELDGAVWLLAVATAVMMLHTGVLAAARTPLGPGGTGATGGALGFAARCALRLGALGALALPLAVWLTGVSVGASLSVLGVDAFGAAVELHGDLGAAALLGAAWGAGAGGAGALLVHAAVRRGAALRAAAEGPIAQSYDPGPYDPSAPYRPPNPDTNPYLRRPPPPEEGGRGDREPAG